jgi:hypothetical protein
MPKVQEVNNVVRILVNISFCGPASGHKSHSGKMFRPSFRICSLKRIYV